MKTENYKKALDRSMEICSKSEKSINDILKKLDSWKLTDPEENKIIIKELVDNDFINESRFAALFTREKISLNKWGRHKIRIMLRARGIKQDDIEEGLKEIDEEYYKDMIRGQIQAKRKSIKASNQFDLKARLYRFASSRGYEKEYIYEVLNNLDT